jgi:hypothetical protein
MPGDKGASGQILDERTVDAWGGSEVELGQGLQTVAAGICQTP